jgi:hypothetical protein
VILFSPSWEIDKEPRRTKTLLDGSPENRIALAQRQMRKKELQALKSFFR